MIEKIILDHLSTAVTAYMEMPQRPPDVADAEAYPVPPFVLIEKTGGGEEEHISRATVAVQSYGGTLYEAAQLNERVKALMKSLIAKSEVCKVSLNSDYNYTDTSTGRYRYQAVFDIVYYEEVQNGE